MRRTRIAGFGLIGLGIGAAVTSLLGPLALDAIKWRVSPNMENQVLGGDIATLAVAAPASIAAGVLWLKDHRIAPLLALGPTLYGLYTFSSMIFAPGYDRYPGNNERAYPLYLGLTILSWTLGAKAWTAIRSTELPDVPKRTRIALGSLLIGVSGLFAMAWIQQISQVVSGNTSLTEYRDDPATFWVIKTYDLAFIIPIGIATGIGLLRNHRIAVRAAYGLVGFQTIMLTAVSGMGIMMLLRDDPSATVALPAVTTSMAVVFAGVAAEMYKIFLRAGQPEQNHGEFRLPEAGRVTV